MPKNNVWDQMAEQGQIELHFEDQSGTLFAVQWSDIASKRLSEKPARCTIVLRELASSYVRHSSGYLATNHEVSVSAQTVRDIYKQANHPLPQVMADKLDRIEVLQEEERIEAEKRRAEFEKKMKEPLQPRRGPRPGY
ncbi:MAG: hypothetical protein Alpg2KO_27550 [Alphaproteobacteria bacterium]